MSYLALSAAFLAVAVAVGVGSALRSGRARGHWAAVGVTVAVLLILTAVFDTVMIAAGLFHYAEDGILGVRIGLAPIEDFAYPIACALALPGLWLLLDARRPTPSRAGLLRAALVASRPVSWINTAFPFAAALLLTTREVDLVLIVGTLYFLIPYNLAMYGINDVFDYASDVNNPRKGGIEGALLAPRLHRGVLWLVAVTNVPFVVLLAAAGGPAVWLALAVSLFAVVAYSAPRLRFKERPVLDSITSSTHFVSPAVVGLSLGGAAATPAVMLSLTAFFLWGMAAHAFGAVQDIEPDRQAGIGSIATALGARATVRLAVALWAIAGLVMLAVPWPGPLAAVLAVPYIVNGARWWNISDAGAAATNTSWRRFIWLNYGSGFLVTLILIYAWGLST